MIENRELVASILKRVNTTRKAQQRWLTACAAYGAGDTTALVGKRRPAEKRIHWMYDDAAQLVRLMGEDYDTRPHNLGQVHELAARVTAALAA